MTIEKTYLGDGVYAEFENDMIKLTTERGGYTETIFIEEEVWYSLLSFVKRVERSS